MGVTIIGVLLLLLGLIILMAVNMVDAFEGVEGFELGIQVAMLAFGVIYMLLAVGFLKGWAWVWTLTMVVLILGTDHGHRFLADERRGIGRYSLHRRGADNAGHHPALHEIGQGQGFLREVTMSR